MYTCIKLAGFTKRNTDSILFTDMQSWVIKDEASYNKHISRKKIYMRTRRKIIRLESQNEVEG